MPCFRPLKGYYAREVNPTGKRSIVFSAKDGYLNMPVDLACGQCSGCRLERSRQWASRLVHENKLHDESCFITLTYDEDNIPWDGSLNVEHFQKFMKRLRKRFRQKVRYFHCGEYGEQFRRPHYHAILFGVDFPDKVFWKQSNGEDLFTSEILQDLWPAGFHSIGDVTFESCAYVARYVTKKVTGWRADSHYHDRSPEYATMSRRPGIASEFFDKFSSDIFPRDEVILRGKKMPAPKYYLAKLEKSDLETFKQVKFRRKEGMPTLEEKLEGEFRLRSREIFSELTARHFKRGYEDGTS